MYDWIIEVVNLEKEFSIGIIKMKSRSAVGYYQIYLAADLIYRGINIRILDQKSNFEDYLAHVGGLNRARPILQWQDIWKTK